MQKLECHGDWLIDYADGAVPPQQLFAAEEHLSMCQACQREVAALHTSGERLSHYFTAVRRTEHRFVPPVRSRWAVVAQRAAAIAACVALIALGYWLNRQARVDVRPVEVVQHDPQKPKTNDPGSTDSAADIAAEIARETQIARLRAAIAILKDEPGMSERSAALQQYLSEAYQVDYELPAM